MGLFKRKQIYPVQAEQISGHAMVTLRGGNARVNPGDWVVTEGERQFVMSNTDFLAEFEPWKKPRTKRDA